MMETKKKKTGCLKIALIVLGVLIALGIVGAALGAPEESGGSPAAVFHLFVHTKQKT